MEQPESKSKEQVPVYIEAAVEYELENFGMALDTFYDKIIDTTTGLQAWNEVDKQSAAINLYLKMMLLMHGATLLQIIPLEQSKMPFNKENVKDALSKISRFINREIPAGFMERFDVVYEHIPTTLGADQNQ